MFRKMHMVQIDGNSSSGCYNFRLFRPSRVFRHVLASISCVTKRQRPGSCPGHVGSVSRPWSVTSQSRRILNTRPGSLPPIAPDWRGVSAGR